MDIVLSFKKYLENIKLAFAYSVLFIFLLFIIDPLYSIFGGGLNLAYDIVNVSFLNAIVVLFTALVFLFIYSLIQTALIYKVGKDYNFSETLPFHKIKNVFYKLFKFNFLFFVLLFLISSILYDINILNNIFVQVILLLITLIFWFVPQSIVLENENIAFSTLKSINYIFKNWFDLFILFIICFILFILTIFLDVLIPGIAGIVVSNLFLVIFIIPYIEILKTENYLNKYNLLKPIKKRF